MREKNPNLTIHDMLNEALKNAEIRVRTKMIPEEAAHLFKEYNDSVSIKDYNDVLNKDMDDSLKHYFKNKIEAGVLQKELSKELNIPLGRSKAEFSSDESQLKKEPFSEEPQEKTSSKMQKLGFWAKVKRIFGYGKID